MSDADDEIQPHSDPLRAYIALQAACEVLLAAKDVAVEDKQRITTGLAQLAETWGKIRQVFEKIGFDNEVYGDVLDGASGNFVNVKKKLADGIDEEMHLQRLYNEQANFLEIEFNTRFAELADFVEPPGFGPRRERPRLLFFVEESEDYFRGFKHAKTDGSIQEVGDDEPKPAASSVKRSRR